MQGKKRTEKYHFLGGAASASFVASIGFAFYGHLVFAVPFMLVAVAAATIIDRYEFRDELENKGILLALGADTESEHEHRTLTERTPDCQNDHTAVNT